MSDNKIENLTSLNEILLIESIEIESDTLLRQMTIDGNELKLDLESEENLISIILIVYYSKILTYSAESKKSKIIIKSVERLVGLINGKQGFRSRRLKELLLIINESVGLPGTVSYQRISDSLRKNDELHQILLSIGKDIREVIDADPNTFYQIIYELLHLNSFLKSARHYADLFHLAEKNLNHSDISRVRSLFSKRKKFLNDTKDTILRIVLLREVPIIFIALISVFSFFIGNQWSKNILTIDHIKSSQIDTSEVETILGKNFKSKEINSKCPLNEESNDLLYKHEYELNFTSLENDFLENSLFEIGYGSGSKMNMTIHYDANKEKSIPSISFIRKKRVSETECAQRVQLRIQSLERDSEQRMIIISTNPIRPIINKVNVAENTIYKSRPTYISYLIFTINNYSGWVLFLLIFVFIVYLIIYAQYHKK